MNEQIQVGVIGGSGLYEIEGFEAPREVAVDTPFGEPSDRLVVGRLQGVRVAFLPRHGRGHRLLPSEINFRANIYALLALGARRIVSVSAVGSMREEIAPGHIVLPEQFYDQTRRRISTFFGNGVVGHVSMADPVCPDLLDRLARAGRETGAVVHRGGVYLCIEGPQFSTRAESRIYRMWGVDVIGMTNATEAKLAREAGLCYATIALSTDYDCWHEEEEDVHAEAVVETLRRNVATAKAMLRAAVRPDIVERPCGCAAAAQGAVLTDPACIPEGVRRDLKGILDL